MSILEFLGCVLEISLVQSLVAVPAYGSWDSLDRAVDQKHLQNSTFFFT